MCSPDRCKEAVEINPRNIEKEEYTPGAYFAVDSEPLLPAVFGAIAGGQYPHGNYNSPLYVPGHFKDIMAMVGPPTHPAPILAIRTIVDDAGIPLVSEKEAQSFHTRLI